jgi:hypothetical protein
MENIAKQEEEKCKTNMSTWLHLKLPDSGDGYANEKWKSATVPVSSLLCVFFKNVHGWPISFLLLHSFLNSNNQAIVKSGWLREQRVSLVEPVWAIMWLCQSVPLHLINFILHLFVHQGCAETNNLLLPSGLSDVLSSLCESTHLRSGKWQVPLQ